MYRRTMNHLSVSTTPDGFIAIEQPTGIGEEERVVVRPEDVDLLVEWLAQAKRELTHHGLRLVDSGPGDDKKPDTLGEDPPPRAPTD